MSLTPQRLRKLVSYREQLEKAQEQVLGATLARRAERATEVELVRDERASLIATPAPSAGAFDPAEIEGLGTYVRRLDVEIIRREEALGRADDEVAAARETLLQRRQERRAMDSLLQQRLAAERLRERRRELHLLDDLGSRRWWDARGDTPASTPPLWREAS
jgi:flagellar export protein FliJ